jgi:hypothetical protein
MVRVLKHSASEYQNHIGSTGFLSLEVPMLIQFTATRLMLFREISLLILKIMRNTCVDLFFRNSCRR